MSMSREGRVARLVPTMGADGKVGWSLVAANGRQIAKAGRTYRDEQELKLCIRELLAERAALRFSFAQADSRLWQWTAHLPVRSTRPGVDDARPIARSARGYLRRDQCVQSLHGFRRSVEQVYQRQRLTGSERQSPW